MEFAEENNMKFNHLKSLLFQVGLVTDAELPKLNFGGKDLAWMKELRYLGVTFVSGKYFTVNISLNCREFLGASLAILQKCNFRSEEILCNLIQIN